MEYYAVRESMLLYERFELCGFVVVNDVKLEVVALLVQASTVRSMPLKFFASSRSVDICSIRFFSCVLCCPILNRSVSARLYITW